jgi:DNA replication protein DnaC
MPARPKEARPYQRMTQPLNPQLLQGLSQERETRAGQNRQLVPQETLQPARIVPQRSICPKCRGAGFLRADVQYGHPNFGKPIPCECKEAERKEKRRQQLREMSNLDAYRSSSFKTFNPRVPGVQEAYEECVAYARNPDGWLLLVGANGCGKTHLAVAIANQCLDRGSVVLFSVVPDLLDHLRAAFAPDANEVYDQLFAKMREAEVLILDDLGAQQSSPWANEKLFQIFNYRYNLGMPTVITANPRGLQGIDERIRSRLSDNSLVTAITFNHARDYRPNHPQRD